MTRGNIDQSIRNNEVVRSGTHWILSLVGELRNPTLVGGICPYDFLSSSLDVITSELFSFVSLRPTHIFSFFYWFFYDRDEKRTLFTGNSPAQIWYFGLDLSETFFSFSYFRLDLCSKLVFIMIFSYLLVSYVYPYGVLISFIREVYLGFNDRSCVIWILRSLRMIFNDENFIIVSSGAGIFIIYLSGGGNFMIDVFYDTIYHKF